MKTTGKLLKSAVILAAILMLVATSVSVDVTAYNGPGDLAVVSDPPIWPPPPPPPPPPPCA